MQYSYKSKNTGKDLIFQNRVNLSKNKDLTKVSPRMYVYIMTAILGIILQ